MRSSLRGIAKVALIVGAAVATATACAPHVGTTAAPDATNPVCAEVILSSPDEVAGQERRKTTAQATTAWGAPDSIILRCGAEVLGPTTEQCIRLQAAHGDATVDWVVFEEDGGWRFVTYGRVPAIEVFVPESEDFQPTSPLVDLTRAVSIVPAQRHCV